MGPGRQGARDGSNCATHAWPNQATGAALPNGSSRRKSEAQISFHRPQHRSLQLPRSQKRLHVLNTCGYIGSSPQIRPTINTHRPRAGQRLSPTHFLDFGPDPASGCRRLSCDGQAVAGKSAADGVGQLTGRASCGCNLIFQPPHRSGVGDCYIIFVRRLDPVWVLTNRTILALSCRHPLSLLRPATISVVRRKTAAFDGGAVFVPVAVIVVRTGRIDPISVAWFHAKAQGI